MTDRMTQEELQKQMIVRFGKDAMAWSFICPQCKDVASLQDFRDAGASPDRAGQDCIGRHLGALEKAPIKYLGRGCDWCSYGLFRGPMAYIAPDGHEIWGFRIAPAPGEEKS